MTRNRFPTRTLLAAALLTALAIPTIVAAGHGPGGHDGDHRGHGGMLAQMDTNRDGQVSRAEADAFHAARLAEMDANADGTIAFEEMQAFHAAQRELRARARFAHLDANGDGNVSVEEMAAMGDERFARMDRNGDGVISADEMRRGQRHMQGGPGK